jgi:hypothetical protein
VDRTQTVLTTALLILLLVAAPLTAWLTATRAYADGQRAESRERAAYRLVPATVVHTGEVRANGAGQFIGETIRLRWADRQARMRYGTIDVGYRARAGATVPVWTDAGGAISHQPRTHERTRSDTAWAGMEGASAVTVPAIVAYLIVRRRLDRRRYGRWEDDWARIAPLWTRRTS